MRAVALALLMLGLIPVAPSWGAGQLHMRCAGKNLIAELVEMRPSVKVEISDIAETEVRIGEFGLY